MHTNTMLLNPPTRRWPRRTLDVPLRIVMHAAEKTVIRDGRGCELSDGGMCFTSGVELKIGKQMEIEFTPAYSGHPIRVRAVTRYRDGYTYGVEFIGSSRLERREIACLRDNVQTLSSTYSPSYALAQ